MAGLGGNLVALLPNGVSVFRFADAFHFDLDAMILAGESIRPFCPSPPVVATGPAPLTAGDLATEIPGHTLTVGRQRLFFAPDGRLFGSAGTDEGDLGTWEITAGRLCRTWTAWDHGRRRCYLIWREGDTYVLDDPTRFVRVLTRRTAGGLSP